MDAVPVKAKIVTCERCSQSLNKDGVVFSCRMGQHQNELVATQSPADVRCSRVCLEHTCKVPKNFIPCGMSVRIIYEFESLQFCASARQRKPVSDALATRFACRC